jgi:translation initiation factor 1
MHTFAYTSFPGKLLLGRPTTYSLAFFGGHVPSPTVKTSKKPIFLESDAVAQLLLPARRFNFAMSKESKERFLPGSAPLTNNPFANLTSDGLPAGPATPTPSPTSKANRIPKPGRVVLRRETAHRAGKVVIVVDAFAPHIGLAAIEELGRRLRQACGCGGAIRDRTIELQGDQVAKIRAFLEAEGFQVAGVK